MPILRALGCEVVGAYDGGDVFDPGYAARFCQQHRIEHVFDTPEALADAVDVAYLGGARWSTRVPLATMLVDRGVGVLIDKPVASTSADLDALAALVDRGGRIAGGSALRWCDEITTWRTSHGEAMTSLATTNGHRLDYGVHASAMVAALLGGPAEAVAARRSDAGLTVSVRWPHSLGGYVVTTSPVDPPYVVHVIGDGVAETLAPDFAGLYRPMLATLLPYLAGRADAPLTFADQCLPERIALAAEVAATDGGWVPLDDPRCAEVRWDEDAFVADYTAFRLAQS